MIYKTYRTLVFKQMRSLMVFTAGQPVFEVFKILNEINRLAEIIKKINAMQPNELLLSVDFENVIYESNINYPLIVEIEC